MKTPLGLPSAPCLFFGGKGGVGKTTAACSAALQLLRNSSDGGQILLFSTDPAHSLADSLKRTIGDAPVEIARHGKTRLLARQMDAAAALARFMEASGPVLAEIAERGTILDKGDVGELLQLSLPGMDEVMALLELSAALEEGGFSRIVVDTAPTGHTSRLLELPRVFETWIQALDRMSEKHRHMVVHFARRPLSADDPVERFLADLRMKVERVRRLLYDAVSASFTLVTIAETMSIQESERYLESLRRQGVPVTDLIVNRVERGNPACAYCRVRAQAQAPALRRITAAFKGLRLHSVPVLPFDVRGKEALLRFGRMAWEEAPDLRPIRARRERVRLPAAPPVDHDFLKSPRRFMIFGGKGGVGKTTAASAAALALARAQPQEQVLLFSIDPAHSLSDCLDEPIGDFKQSAAGMANLDAREIEPESHFQALKERFQEWTDGFFSSLESDSNWEIQFDRDAMREAVALAPPGIDEIVALSALSDLLAGGQYARIVLDTAPTGHLVRFLELPEIALSWIHAFLRLLLKYKNVAHHGTMAEELLNLARDIKRVSALITDSENCEFVVVSIAEPVVLAETERLAGQLRQLRVPVKGLLVNNLLPPEAAGCRVCSPRRTRQQRLLRAFRAGLSEMEKLYVAPQHPVPVRGRLGLEAHYASWQSLEKFTQNA